jgi:DNA-binding transcriptional MerR regulator
MTTRTYAVTLRRRERQQLTLDELALHADVHPALAERFVEFGLIAPVERSEHELLFDSSAIMRLRTIVRLRRSLGINLAGISVVLDLIDRLCAAQRENEILRNRLK